MSFDERMAPAADFETALMARLCETGWPAFPFGQGQLPEECRDRLKRFVDGSHRPCLLRWMPDIITFRDTGGGRSYVALIDAKCCGNRPNYSIELNAIETMEIYTDYLFTPAFFVFDDYRLLTPREARQRGTRGPTSNNGSGTPYVLVERRFSRPMSDVFKPKLAA